MIPSRSFYRVIVDLGISDEAGFPMPKTVVMESSMTIVVDIGLEVDTLQRRKIWWIVGNVYIWWFTLKTIGTLDIAYKVASCPRRNALYLMLFGLQTLFYDV